MNLKSAIVLLLCVPLIPISIIAVQKFSKKLLAKYWEEYTTLSDSFLENLQGLTILKIYQDDAYKNDEMNKQAERFRKITMKVLTMQLNSVTLMDLIAFGGAAIGIIVAVTEFFNGSISFFGCFIIVMLSAEFFIPLRLLGSFFHIAMNGMAASDKIFKLLDRPEYSGADLEFNKGNSTIEMKNVCFAYVENRNVLDAINLTIKEKQLTAIVGESGCGKSTIADLLVGINKEYKDSIKIGNTDLSKTAERNIMNQVILVNFESYLFKGNNP